MAITKIKKRTATVGDTAYVFFGTEADEKEIQRKIAALVVPNGPAVKLDNGDSIHVIDEVIFNKGQEGSAQFTWDFTGTRVRHARVEYRTVNGVQSRRILRIVYKSF